AGRNAGDLVTKDTSPSEIARLMVGRELRQIRSRTPVSGSGAVLEIRGLHVRSDRGASALQGIDLTVNAGEILGVAGVGGNGQSELAECVLGLREPTAGSIVIGGADIAHDDPKRTRERGVRMRLGAPSRAAGPRLRAPPRLERAR